LLGRRTAPGAPDYRSIRKKKEKDGVDMREEEKAFPTKLTFHTNTIRMSVNITDILMIEHLENDDERARRDGNETPSTVGQASVTESWSKKIKQLDDNCLFGELRYIFNCRAKNKLRLTQDYLIFHFCL
jgi:hypothetical protein